MSIDVGEAPSGGGLTGIPPKYLLIGAGVAGVALLLVLNRKSGDVSGQVDSYGTGQTLGPNASLALGDLENKVLQQSGDLQQLFQQSIGALGTNVNTGLGGISSQLGTLGTTLDTQAAHLSDLGAAVAAVPGQVNDYTRAYGELLAKMEQQTQDFVRIYGQGLHAQFPWAYGDVSQGMGPE